MLTLTQWRDKRDGRLLAGFTIRNGAGKLIAIGAAGSFVQAAEKRYEADRDLMRKVGQMAGIEPRRVYT